MSSIFVAHKDGAKMSERSLEFVRESYDRVSDEYARHFAHELENKPLDREWLDRFAREVAGKGEICDLGCGPGHVAQYLRTAGVNVFGLDLSPRMVEQARERNPDLAFREGNMMALDLAPGSLAGIVAFYAIVNIPKKSLPLAFREMERVLQPGGLLLLSFHIGDRILHRDEFLGRPVSIDFFFFQTSEIRSLLADAGFEVEKVMEREPYAPDVEYPSRRAYVFARKPVRPSAHEGSNKTA